MGLLLWMSHPCWPSLAWQTYDYYFDHTAAYYGSRKGCEPIHVQWNPATDDVEVVNYSAGDLKDLAVRVEILNTNGSVKWKKKAALDSLEDSVSTPIRMEYPPCLTPVHFIRLKLMHGGRIVSENLYWRGIEEGNLRALRTLPKVKLEAANRVERHGERWELTTDLHNVSTQPALMVRLKVVREKSGDRILPVLYSDNYVTLMPGERRTIRTRLAEVDTRGEAPRIVVEGFNTGQVLEKSISAAR